MNKANYCTLAAAKRLYEAGIVLETEYCWVFDQYGSYLSITKPRPGKAVPAPTMAEVWRELPDTEELIPLICRYIEESNISGSSVMQIIIDICRSPDRLIDLLIWVRKEQV